VLRDLCRYLDASFEGKYNFVFLRLKFNKTTKNLGFAFVNFNSHEDALNATQIMCSHTDWDVKWAYDYQSVDEIADHFKGHHVMDYQTQRSASVLR